MFPWFPDVSKFGIPIINAQTVPFLLEKGDVGKREMPSLQRQIRHRYEAEGC
jgi:hypothetical protein